jgi:hypothetical protein
MVRLSKVRSWGAVQRCYSNYFSRLKTRNGRLLLNLVGVIILSSWLFFVRTAHSQDYFQEIVANYVERAFPNPDMKLRKFIDPSFIAYGMDCYGDDIQRCQETLKLFPSDVFENENVRTGLDPNGKVRFVFESKKSLAYLSTKMLGFFSHGINDVTDLDCQLYMLIRDNQTTGAAIVVSLDASVQKKMMCMLVNFYRVIGLSQKNNANFSETWPKAVLPKKDLTYSELISDSSFRYMLHAVKVTAYIHSCKITEPGMTKDEVVSKLVVESDCIQKLKRK